MAQPLTSNRQRKLLTVGAVCCAAIFLFLRFFKINLSLNFFGDMGRDFLILQQWQQSGKPPLLGPSNSAISFNQSAIYFYLLFPFYLVTDHSPYASLIACACLYLVLFGLAFYYFRHKPLKLKQFLIIFALIALHPIFVRQHRYVWNPSLITPFLLLAFYSLQELRQSFKHSWMWLVGLSLAMAASLNYSIVPTLIAFYALSLLSLNFKQTLQLLMTSTFSFLLINLPTLVFEIRHNFFLFSKLGSQEVLQTSYNLQRKLRQLTQILVPLKQNLVSQIASGFIILGLLLLVVILATARLTASQWPSKLVSKSVLDDQQLQAASFITLLSLILTFFSPFQLHKHYLFGVLTFLFVTISRVLVKLKNQQQWIGGICLAIIFGLFLQPSLVRSYFQPTPVKLKTKKQCLRKLCRQYQQPIYFNLNSSSHNHQALGYVFLANELGCQAVSARQIEKVRQAPLMAVVSEACQYQPQKTDYYELSLFQARNHLAKLQCGPELSVDLFARHREGGGE